MNNPLKDKGGKYFVWLTAAAIFFIFVSKTQSRLIYNYSYLKYLGPIRHEYQKKNQCGSVTAGMILNYWLGLKKNQFEIGAVLRPHPDDKHVLPGQIIDYLSRFGIKAKPIYSPDYSLIKKFIDKGIPVVVYQKTGLNGKFIGHYSLVRGYDESKKQSIAADSYFGPNYRISYKDFDELWRSFAYFMMPVYPANKEKLVESILGPLLDQDKMLDELENFIQNRIQKSAADPFDYLNFGLIAYLRKNYTAAKNNA